MRVTAAGNPPDRLRGVTKTWQQRTNELALGPVALGRGAVLAVLASLAFTAWPQAKPADLTNESIEDLMNIPVTSVSKTAQNFSQVASAAFVITPDAIRRSGATNIPDLLRMVPGLDVGRINGNTWAVSARGFNSRFSDKVLVLMDGRSVYTPTFAGVFWEVFREGIDLSLVGQNLLRDRHEEFFDSTLSTPTTLVKRAAYAKVQWIF